MFSTAVRSRDPWLADDQVWVALDSIRQAIAQTGFTPPKPVVLMDTLDELGCKVCSGMDVVEAHRTISDELQWVLLGDDLFTGQLAEHVRLRATDRDAADARAGLRMIGPT